METATICTAGSSRGNPGPAAIAALILDSHGEIVTEISETIGNATDTFAEYYAVMRSLQVVKEYFSEKTKDMLIEIKLSNELVKKQLCGEAEIKEPGLVPYFIEIHNMQVFSFPNLIFTQVERESNQADHLVQEALSVT